MIGREWSVCGRTKKASHAARLWEDQVWALVEPTRKASRNCKPGARDVSKILYRTKVEHTWKRAAVKNEHVVIAHIGQWPRVCRKESRQCVHFPITQEQRPCLRSRAGNIADGELYPKCCVTVRVYLRRLVAKNKSEHLTDYCIAM